MIFVSDRIKENFEETDEEDLKVSLTDVFEQYRRMCTSTFMPAIGPAKFNKVRGSVAASIPATLLLYDCRFLHFQCNHAT